MVFGSPKVCRILMDTENYSYMCVCGLFILKITYLYLDVHVYIYNMFSFLFIHAKQILHVFWFIYKIFCSIYTYIHLKQTLK